MSPEIGFSLPGLSATGSYSSPDLTPLIYGSVGFLYSISSSDTARASRHRKAESLPQPNDNQQSRLSIQHAQLLSNLTLANGQNTLIELQLSETDRISSLFEPW